MSKVLCWEVQSWGSEGAKLGVWLAGWDPGWQAGGCHIWGWRPGWQAGSRNRSLSGKSRPDPTFAGSRVRPLLLQLSPLSEILTEKVAASFFSLPREQNIAWISMRFSLSPYGDLCPKVEKSVLGLGGIDRFYDVSSLLPLFTISKSRT